MDIFQCLSSNSVPLYLTSWGNSQDLRRKIVDLHKSDLSLGAILKRLKIPHSSVQTIVRKYKHHGTTQLSYRSGRRRVLCPRDERTLRKVQINPRTTAKDLVKILEEMGTKVSISTVKRVLYRHNLKGRSARKKPLHQNRHKRDCTFWRNVLWSDETKENCLTIMTIVMFGGKRGMLADEEHHPNREARGLQHHVVEVLC